MSNNDVSVYVLDPEVPENNERPLKELVNDFGEEFIEEWNKVLAEQKDGKKDKPNYGYVTSLLYYQPQLRVKLAVVLLLVGVLLVLAFVEQVPAPITAIWAVLAGLVVLAIVASTIHVKLKQRRADSEKTIQYHKLSRVVQYTKEGLGSHWIVFFFAVFGFCAILVPDNEISFVFLTLFGIGGLSVVLLIGFQAWNKTIGVESYVIVEAVFDIILTTRFSSTSSEETAFLIIAGMLAGIAVLCAFLHIYLRWKKDRLAKEKDDEGIVQGDLVQGEESSQPENQYLQWLLNKSEWVILVAFLTTDAADVVLLASQLLLLNTSANTSCNIDPKLIVVAALLALNPCVTELSAAFKSAEERNLSRDLHVLQQNGDEEGKISEKRAALFTEQARRRRMQRKAVLQTVLIGLGAFPGFYIMAFLFTGQGSWYLLLVPVAALCLYYFIDFTRLRESWIRRRALNNYFFAASFRAFGACFALILGLSSTVFAECNEQLAFVAWALYQLAPLIVVTIVKSVQNEDLLTPFGPKERYEDSLPKIIRPACADLAWYFMDKVNIAKNDKDGRKEEKYSDKLFKLFLTCLNDSNKKDEYVLAMLIDAIGSLAESASGDLQLNQSLLQGVPEQLVNVVLKYYDMSKRSTQPYSFFQSSVERVVVSLLLREDKEVLEVAATAAEKGVKQSRNEDDLRVLAMRLDAIAKTLREDLSRLEHAEILARIAVNISSSSPGLIGGPTEAKNLDSLGEILREKGELSESKRIHKKALALRREHVKALALGKKTGIEGQDLGDSLNNLGLALQAEGKYEEAKPLINEAITVWRAACGNRHQKVAVGLNNLASVLSDQGKYGEAMPLFEESLKIRKKVFGDVHPAVAESLNNVGQLLSQQGKFDEALPMYYEALGIKEKVYGKEHPSYALQLNNIALLLSDQGNYGEARPMYEESLRIRKLKLGSEHPDVAQSLNNLAQLLSEQGNYEEAEKLQREALEIDKNVYGEDHHGVARDLNNLSLLLSAQGNYAEAEKLQRDAVEIFKNVYGDEHPDVATNLNNLALLLSAQGKYVEAEKLQREAMRIRKNALGVEHPLYASDLNNLAQLLSAQGNYEEAEKLQRQGLAISENVYGKEHPDYALKLNNLAWLLWEQDNDSEEAVELGREALRILEVKQPDHPNTQACREKWG